MLCSQGYSRMWQWCVMCREVRLSRGEVKEGGLNQYLGGCDVTCWEGTRQVQEEEEPERRCEASDRLQRLSRV